MKKLISLTLVLVLVLGLTAGLGGSAWFRSGESG